jgi:hypothetical protein
MNVLSLENILKCRVQSVSCAFKLPEYYFLQEICATRTSDVRGPHCGHPWYMLKLEKELKFDIYF